MRTREEIKTEVLIELMQLDAEFRQRLARSCRNDSKAKAELEPLVSKIQGLQLQLAALGERE